MKNNNCICYLPYIRNSIAYNQDFWYICVKWSYLQMFFSIFQNFNFLVWGVKGQKTVQNDKIFCLSCFVSQEPYIIGLSFMVHMFKIIISSGIFFHFFKILIFGVVGGVKGQKKVQNDKKFCPSHSISQEPYIMWLWFIVQMCKVIISSGDFFIFFKISIFQVVRE